MNPNLVAAEQVMQDLVDCLLAEEFFGPETPQLMALQAWLDQHPQQSWFKDLTNTPSVQIWCWQYDPREQRSLLLALQPGITQALERVPGSVVLACQADNDAISSQDGYYVELSPQDFLQRALLGVSGRYQGNEKGMQLFKDVLEISERQTRLSLQHNIESRNLLAKSPADFYLAMEQWASLRDRPYHPLAKAKQGLTDDEYRQYQAEFAQPVTLNWVAVDKDWLQTGEGVTELAEQYPANYLLPESLASKLAQELQDLGLANSHIALPVHPWQFEHVLDQQLGDYFSDGRCRRLSFTSERFFATSSLRSMTPCFDSSHHLKLPMAVYSLGASRYLPAVKMINGGFSERLLHQALALDETLQQKLHLCDESKWWSFMPPGASLFDEGPRHLAAMVRSYPAALFEDNDCRVMPMAALGTPLPDSQDHFFDEWMAYRQLPSNHESVITLFQELCHCFFEVNLRMFRLGMLAEVHGQNAVLVWKSGQASGLLLRDHDSLRILVPWLEQHGMADPEYRIKPGHKNTLYHDEPEALLFWLQTLGIQVNMRSIIDTLAQTYEIAQAQLWQSMAEVLQQQIDQIDFSGPVRAMLTQQLFEAPTWPQKHLLSPMIDRAGGPGSMPFGQGEVVNPFHN